MYLSSLQPHHNPEVKRSDPASTGEDTCLCRGEPGGGDPSPHSSLCRSPRRDLMVPPDKRSSRLNPGESEPTSRLRRSLPCLQRCVTSFPWGILLGKVFTPFPLFCR